MQLEIAYFAWVRERMGCGVECVDLPGDVATVAELLVWLAGRSEAAAAAFADGTKIRAAIDGAMVGGDASINGAREIALFPPVTGG